MSDSSSGGRNARRARFDRRRQFNPGEPGVFNPILDLLLKGGDFYLHLADLRSYSEAHAPLGEFYLKSG